MRLPRRIKTLLASAFLAAALAFITGPLEADRAPAGSAAQAESGDVVIVRLRTKFFDPPVVVIHEGDTVVWVNETRGAWHDVQSYESEFSFPRMEYGDTAGR